LTNRETAGRSDHQMPSSRLQKHAVAAPLTDANRVASAAALRLADPNVRYVKKDSKLKHTSIDHSRAVKFYTCSDSVYDLSSLRRQ
jgi:hypothetical protein